MRGSNKSALQVAIAATIEQTRTNIGDLDYSEKLDILTEKAMREADKILNMRLRLDEKDFPAILRAKVATIASIFTTQVRVNEGMFKQRQTDTLQKLLDTLSKEEKKLISGDQA